jgi:hypothetical protein
MKKALETLLTNIANLVKVKTIWSLLILYTVCRLALNGMIEISTFMTLASTIVMFYFSKDDNKPEGGK